MSTSRPGSCMTHQDISQMDLAEEYQALTVTSGGDVEVGAVGFVGLWGVLTLHRHFQD